MIKPNTVNILGHEYTIEYVDKPSDVDIYHRSSLWGQIDYWTFSIRIYKGNRKEDFLEVILHEIIHGIAEELHINISDTDNVVGLLALGLADTLIRNNWIREIAE